MSPPCARAAVRLASISPDPNPLVRGHVRARLVLPDGSVKDQSVPVSATRDARELAAWVTLASGGRWRLEAIPPTRHDLPERLRRRHDGPRPELAAAVARELGRLGVPGSLGGGHRVAFDGPPPAVDAARRRELLGMTSVGRCVLSDEQAQPR